MSPNSLHKREYEEYRRKEQIIESQLRHLTKNSSQKNVMRSSDHSNGNFTQATATPTPLTRQSSHLRNRKSTHIRTSLTELNTNSNNGPSSSGFSGELASNNMSHSVVSNYNYRHPNQENINVAVIELNSNTATAKDQVNSSDRVEAASAIKPNQRQSLRLISKQPLSHADEETNDHQSFGEIF